MLIVDCWLRGPSISRTPNPVKVKGRIAYDLSIPYLYANSLLFFWANSALVHTTPNCNFPAISISYHFSPLLACVMLLRKSNNFRPT
jgi:hypothetical protein